MKTLIICGSPRKSGDSMTLVKELIKHLDSEVEIISTYYDNIKPCFDCRFCWDNNGCCIEDDMQKVYKLIDTVDNVVIASPIYFSELTGKLLSFASRLQTFYVRKHIRGDKEFELKEKKGVLILTGGGDGNPKPAIRRAKTILEHMNVELIGSVLSLKTNDIASKDDKDALKEVKNISEVLNKIG